MPIARIITSMPEYSGGLVRDLNSRGFEVHIISPEQSPAGTADLEIRLDAVPRSMDAEVAVERIPALTAAEAALKLAESGLLQPPMPPTAPPQEDIWTMLASFDGDAATQDLPAVAGEIHVEESHAGILSQDVAATAHALSDSSAQLAEIGNEVAGPEITAGETTEVTPSITHAAGNPTDRERNSFHVDPDLVPSMFSFSSSDEDSSTDQEAAASSERSPWRGSELRKTNLRSWDSRSPRVAAAAAGCAVVVIAMVLALGRRHSLPKAVNSPAQETQTSVPFHSTAHSGNQNAEHNADHAATSAEVSQPVVPIKPAVLVSSVSPSKAARHSSEGDTAVAEDTIVRYGNAKKVTETPSTKTSAVRYYSDLD